MGIRDLKQINATTHFFPFNDDDFKPVFSCSSAGPAAYMKTKDVFWPYLVHVCEWFR